MAPTRKRNILSGGPSQRPGAKDLCDSDEDLDFTDSSGGEEETKDNETFSFTNLKTQAQSTQRSIIAMDNDADDEIKEPEAKRRNLRSQRTSDIIPDSLPSLSSAPKKAAKQPQKRAAAKEEVITLDDDDEAKPSQRATRKNLRSQRNSNIIPDSLLSLTSAPKQRQKRAKEEVIAIDDDEEEIKPPQPKKKNIRSQTTKKLPAAASKAIENEIVEDSLLSLSFNHKFTEKSNIAAFEDEKKDVKRIIGGVLSSQMPVRQNAPGKTFKKARQGSFFYA